MKYIIDADPGIDDAIAIAMAIKNKLDVIGFTIATGNLPVDKVANNIKIIEDILGINVPIFKGGHENPSNETAVYAHGIDGLGYAVYPQNNSRQVERTYAENFMIKASKKYKNNLTIICLGPLTNLYHAIKKDKFLPLRINKVIMMGTAYDPAKLNDPYKEFNIRTDPVAAKAVLSAPFKDIYAITHEVGLCSYVEKDYILNLRESKDITSRFVGSISEKYMEFSYQRYGTIGLGSPDPAAMSYAIDPDIFKFEDFACDVITSGPNKGICYTTKFKSNVHLSVDFDLEKYRKLFKNTFK